MRPDAAQRKFDVREVINALHWIVRTVAAWRDLLTDFPPREAVSALTDKRRDVHW